MIRLIPLIGGLLLMTAPAVAGGFTGFYAGVNAGYGQDREVTPERRHAPASAGAADSRDDGLPPSAAAAIVRPKGPGRTHARR